MREAFPPAADLSHRWHYFHSAHKADEGGPNKRAAVNLIIVGFFLALMLIGTPLMLIGFYKLCK
jgi:hypothetical protein